jgi:hypothetical protein
VVVNKIEHVMVSHVAVVKALMDIAQGSEQQLKIKIIIDRRLILNKTHA